MPGLVQSVANGHVVLANALGSGILESPALLAFLPEICRRLLGEELKLPSVTTWWCGRAEEWSYVQAHFDELVIRPAASQRGQKPIVVASLSEAERAELLAAMRREPAAFVAHPQITRSTVPVWQGGAINPGRPACGCLPRRIATVLMRSCRAARCRSLPQTPAPAIR